MSELKRTPLFDKHQQLNAKLVPFAGYEMPIQYTSIIDEHNAVRQEAGLFDVSHMGEVFIEGKDAASFVNYLITNDVNLLSNNQILYTLMCNDKGGVVDDLLVYKYHEQKLLLVVNASNIEKDYEWIVSHKGDFDVTISNQSESYSQLAIQGPNASAVLSQLTDIQLDDIKFFYFKDQAMIYGKPCLLSRSGYTGEDGFEIYLKNEDVGPLWDKLIELGVKPIGLGARDTLRFEAALPLYGNELTDEISPIEAGFKFFVKLDKDFIGKDVLLEQVTNGLNRKSVGLRLIERGIPRHGYKVYNENQEEIGFVTTGYMLPNHEDPLAVALIDTAYTTKDQEVYVGIRNKFIKAIVVGKKFIDKKYKK